MRFVLTLALASCGGANKPTADAEPDAAIPNDVGDGARSQTAPDPLCIDNGCLRRLERVGDYGVSDLAPYLAADVAIDNGYSIYTIEFATSGRTALATVAVPYRVATPEGGWHVVANNHGTVGVEDRCQVAGTIGGAGLAGTFAARGLVGVAVDYPGLGTPGVHPYLVSDVEGHASLDAIRATRIAAAHLHVPLSNRFAVVGLSQGGHATLAAAARHRSYAPELDIRAFSAAAPATLFEEEWRVGVGIDGPHIAYHAMMVYAWADHYGFTGHPLWTRDTAAVIDDVMRSSCSYPLADGTPTIAARLGSRATTIFDPAFLHAYRSGEWGDYAAFQEYFASNRIGAYPQSAPLKIYQGDADAIVLRASTDGLVAKLRAGGVEVEYEIVPSGTHTDVAYGFVASAERRTAESIAWIKARLAG